MPGARVQLSGPTSREVTTASDGSYDVRNLPAGTYTVTITPPKGLSLYHPYYPRDQQPPPPTMTLTHPFECAEASAWPRTDSQITGVLLDSAGRPAAGEPVELIAAANATSRDKQIPHLSARTDPEGRFAFAFMPPGNYLVGVNLKNPPPASQVDLRSYHPGVSEPPRATVVAVEAGSRIPARAVSAGRAAARTSLYRSGRVERRHAGSGCARDIDGRAFRTGCRRCNRAVHPHAPARRAVHPVGIRAWTGQRSARHRDLAEPTSRPLRSRWRDHPRAEAGAIEEVCCRLVLRCT